jgi:hypothetical protein
MKEGVLFCNFGNKISSILSIYTPHTCFFCGFGNKISSQIRIVSIY